MLAQTRRPRFVITVICLFAGTLLFGVLHRGHQLGGLRPWEFGKNRPYLVASRGPQFGADVHNDGMVEERFRKDPSRYLRSIADIRDTSVTRLSCPSVNSDRYGYLNPLNSRKVPGEVSERSSAITYFFALNLYQAIKILPRLIGSMVEVIKLLGPENCAISIVEGRSTDGSFEVLSSLTMALPPGTKYFFSSSPIDPMAGSRMSGLAELRNLAIEPLVSNPSLFDSNQTSVVFLNDVLACPDDILELIHQRHDQSADMTCGMDWNWNHYSGAWRLTFYDVWIARTMSGQSFFHIPHGGSWNGSAFLFPFDNDADRLTRARYQKCLPFQVFSCWNGAVVFSARPLLDNGVRFRVNRPDECYQGEVSLFTKDLWKNGYSKIAVVPAVNLGYEIGDAKRIRKVKGLVSDGIRLQDRDTAALAVPWKDDPPAKTLCIPDWVRKPQYWVDWNE